jgi:transcriptional regulator
MYTPRHFREDDLDAMHAVIREHSFATLVSLTGDGLLATHLPLLLDAGRGEHGTLTGHMARANPHWRSFGEGEALAIFHGPHAYISPSWYEDRAANVPTWNYVAVHVYGTPRLIEDDVAVADLLAQTAATYEAALPAPWSPGEFDAAKYAAMRGGVAAFDLPITRIEGKAKLNQNRTEGDRAGVIAALGAADHSDGRAIASAMARRTYGP